MGPKESALFCCALLRARQIKERDYFSDYCDFNKVENDEWRISYGTV